MVIKAPGAYQGSQRKTTSADPKKLLFIRKDADVQLPAKLLSHPCFLGNAHAIGWNSDVTGIPQVYAAHVPEGFLDGLD